MAGALSNLSVDYEILFRDDGSHDESRKALEQVASTYGRVKCFYNERNRGLGFTLRKLFSDAQGKVIIYLDCDLPFGVDVLPLMLDGIQRYDMVVASRYLNIKNKILWRRKIASRLYYILCKILFNMPVCDIGSGSVAMKKGVVNSLCLRTEGFDIHAEIFAKALRANFSIKEIPAVCRDKGLGSFRILKHGPKIVIDTLKLWFRLTYENRFC